MFPARIDEYLRPQTVAEALAAIARYPDGEGMFLAGGQSLMQAIKSRMVRPSCIVDLQNVAALSGIDQGDGLTIGAMTRYIEVAGHGSLPPAYAALADAARRVGDRQVRNRGTIGGSVCWNYVASCTPTVVLGTDGTLTLASVRGETREVRAGDFFLGPFETARDDDEILLSISWPAAPPNSGSAYQKWGLVSDAVPLVGICVSVTLDGAGRCAAARVAVAGLADGAQLAPAGGAALIGSDGGGDSLSDAMAAVAGSVETHSDHWADAAYRRQLIRTIGVEVAASAFQRARGGA
jgi:aerobic carbon-monoxide dehydrogenase medium subunit